MVSDTASAAAAVGSPTASNEPLDPDQHFLVNRAKIDVLLDAADLRAESVVAELGAGKGTVAARVPPLARLDLIELDPALCNVLRERFTARADVHVRCEDALLVLARERASYDVILSNLPASLTPQVLDALASGAGDASTSRPRIFIGAAPRDRPRTAIVAAPSSLELSSWGHQLDISPIATAEGADFDPPQPFITRFVRVLRRPAS